MGVTSAYSISRPFLILPDGWDTAWKAAKAASGTARANIAMIGDSIFSGVKASNFVTKGIPAIIKDTLKARGHVWGADFWPVSWANAISTPGGYAWAGTPPWSFTISGNLLWAAGGYHKHLVWVRAGTNHANGTDPGALDVASFSTPYATTKIELVLHPGGLQSGFSGAVDGGAVIPVTEVFDGYTKKKDLGVLSNALHTVALGTITGQFRFTMSGAITYEDTDKGISLARLGGLGVQIKDYIDTGGQPTNLTRQLQGFYSGGLTGFGFPMQPHLAIIELGANDCHVGNTLAEVREGLVRMVSAIRRGRANASIMFVLPCYPDGVSSDVTTTLSNPYTWSSYVNVILEVAALYGCAVANIHQMWGETPVADGLCTSSIDLHPTDAGMESIADLIASVI